MDMDGSKISTEESSQLQQEIPKSHHADLHPRWTNELDFTHFDALPRFANSPPLSGRERVIFWIKAHFVWLVYLTMIIQLVRKQVIERKRKKKSFWSHTIMSSKYLWVH